MGAELVLAEAIEFLGAIASGAVPTRELGSILRTVAELEHEKLEELNRSASLGRWERLCRRWEGKHRG